MIKKIGEHVMVVSYLTPSKKISGTPFSSRVSYKYFSKHINKTIAKKLSNRSGIICWYSGHQLTPTTCALRKFVSKKGYCKRCTLFQNDALGKELRARIEECLDYDLKEEKDGRD